VRRYIAQLGATDDGPPGADRVLTKPLHDISLATYSGQLSLLLSVGQEMSSSLRATGWRHSVADWGGGISASCKPRI